MYETPLMPKQLSHKYFELEKQNLQHIIKNINEIEEESSDSKNAWMQQISKALLLFIEPQETH